jgi:Methyltransferase domain
VTEGLPFSDNSFDYVRLNDTMAVIPQDCWDFVLSEIHRVMTPGGRLELIHDQLCFSSVSRDASVSSAKRMTTPPRSKIRPHDDDWEAEMRNCNNLERLYLEMLAQRYGVHPQPRAILLDAIQRQFGNGGLVKTSNFHVCLPSKDFVARNCDGALKGTEPKRREFGLGITIDWGPEKSIKTGAKAPRSHHGRSFSLTNLSLTLNKKLAKAIDAVQSPPACARYQPPGVVVFPTSSDGSRRPMTFISMSPTELEMHSNKHVHSVISAKSALEAHNDELRVKGKPSISHEVLDDALWQYSL